MWHFKSKKEKILKEIAELYYFLDKDTVELRANAHDSQFNAGRLFENARTKTLLLEIVYNNSFAAWCERLNRHARS